MEEIIEIKINDLIIKKRDDYYVAEWKDGHYRLEDILEECELTIDTIKHFNQRYLNK